MTPRYVCESSLGANMPRLPVTIKAVCHRCQRQAMIWVNCLPTSLGRRSRNAKSIWLRVVGEDQRESLKPRCGKKKARVRGIHTFRFFHAVNPRLARRSSSVAKCSGSWLMIRETSKSLKISIRILGFVFCFFFVLSFIKCAVIYFSSFYSDTFLEFLEINVQ